MASEQGQGHAGGIEHGGVVDDTPPETASGAS